MLKILLIHVVAALLIYIYEEYKQPGLRKVIKNGDGWALVIMMPLVPYLWLAKKVYQRFF